MKNNIAFEAIEGSHMTEFVSFEVRKKEMEDDGRNDERSSFTYRWEETFEYGDYERRVQLEIRRMERGEYD